MKTRLYFFHMIILTAGYFLTIDANSQKIPNQHILTQVPSDAGIFLGNSMTYFHKNKVREMWFGNADTSSAEPDTVFYGFRKDGFFLYERAAIIMVFPSPQPPQFMGYDTTVINRDCKPGFDCKCVSFSLFDSFYCDVAKKTWFLKTFAGGIYRWSFYNSSNCLKEEIIVHVMPDGGFYYKTVYIYNEKKKLSKIQYYWISVGTFPDKRTITGKDYLATLAAEKYIAYNTSGDILSIKTYTLNDNTKKMGFFSETKFRYKGSLLTRIDHDFPNKDFSYSEKTGYFYFR